jgi:competence protein ComEC
VTTLLAALAAAVVGGIVGEHLGAAAAPGPLVLGVALLGTALVRRGRQGATLVVLGCGLLGAATTQRALHGVAVSPLAGPAGRAQSGVLTATLLDDPSGPRFAVAVLVRADRFAGRDAGGRTVLARASGDATTRLRVLEAGDRVVLVGRLGPLEGYDARYRWRHAVARLEVQEVRAFTPPVALVPRLANGLRTVVLRGAAGLPAEERALLAGFLLGDTRGLTPATVDDFRAAGLSHLLAVSGANVAFVLVLVAPVLARLRTGPRFAGGIAVLVLFGTMTRWEPSVLRAAAMAGLVMLAAFLGRPAVAGRVLALAALGLLLVDPFLRHSVGFLLSCGACAGIVVLAAPITGRLRGPAWVREGLGVTLAAQVGVAPVLLPVFGSVPLVAIPANLVAVPVVGPLTVWGMVAGLAGGWLGPPVARVLQLPTLVLLRWVRTVAGIAAEVPVAVDGRATLALVAGGCLLAALLGAARHRARRLVPDGRGARGQGDRSHPPDAGPPPAPRPDRR